MFESILDSSTGTLSITNELLCMGVSIILGIILAYSHTIKNKYNKKFLTTLVVLPLLVQVVITMVNGNVGTGVAIAGTFSLIKFRSIEADSRQLLSIFFAMAIGLSTGEGQLLFAIVFTVIGAISVIVLSKLKFGERENVKNLKILIPEDLDYEEMFKDTFEKYTTNSKLLKAKTINMGSLYELDYEIEIKDGVKGKDLIDDIRVKNGNLKVMLSTPVLNENL